MATLRITDVNNIVNNACHEQFKSFLRGNKIKLDTICLGGSVVASMAGMGDPKVMAFITGAAVANFGNSVVKAYDDTVKFGRQYRMELLAQTEEYQRCKMYYESYISKVGDFIADMGIDDSLDIAMLYMEMLYSGFISAPGQFHYHKFKTDLDMCSPLMGARVTSGGAVCRHIASNLIDIYRYLGIPATYLAVVGTDGSVVSAIKDRILPFKTNHAVVLVGDDYGKYVIDPTWGTVAEFKNNDNFAHIVYNRGNVPMYHVHIDGTVEWQKATEYTDYIKLRIMRPAHFRKGEIRQAHQYAKDYVFANQYLFNRLRYRINTEMFNIAQLEQLMSGYSDKAQISTGKKLVRK